MHVAVCPQAKILTKHPATLVIPVGVLEILHWLASSRCAGITAFLPKVSYLLCSATQSKGPRLRFT